jgi:2-C-methyl-D-erythritol 4-phosphate cytidylyltransferase
VLASSPSPSCAAILVAAGTSSRMGHDKLAWCLGGVPVLRRTLDAFLAAETISSVILVCPEERWGLLDADDFPKPVARTDGGESRQESVARGLEALDASISLVAVHDGARPLVSPEDINRAVEAAIAHRAASLARRATETMKRSDAEDFCVESVCRENLWCMETPQVFELNLLREAYNAVAVRGLHVTDEVSAVQAIGVKGKFVEALYPNLKITTPADLALAEALLQKKS